MSQFENKVILVTGTSSGMGRATAIELAREGATVICAARRADRGEEILEKIEAVSGKGDFVKTDTSKSDEVSALFDHIGRKYGRLDGAFNNAGTEIDHHSLPDIPLEDFDRVFAVNTRGTFMCLQHEMRMMREQKSGVIVNTSSVGGVWGLRHSSAYVASKHAVVGLTKSAALDAAEFNVRVNAICPGSVDTEMMYRWTHGDPQIAQHLANYAPLKRVGSPQEIADAVLWLMSDKSTYVTGLIMEIDGGVTAGLTM